MKQLFLFTSRFTLLILLCHSFIACHAQDLELKQNLSQKFTDYTIVDINSSEIYDGISIESRQNFIRIPLGEDGAWNLELQVNDIISDRYTLVSGEGTLGNPVKESRVIPMTGKLASIPNSSASLSFNKGFIYGYVQIGQSTYFIEPLYNYDKNTPKDKFIIYSSNDILPMEGLQCGYELYEAEMNKYRDRSKPEDTGTRMPGQCFEVEYAIAADWSMVTKYGSATGVENHVTGVVNNVQTNYDNEFADEIEFEIVTFWISPCSTCDPWPNSTNSEIVLNSFTNWAPGGFGTTHDVGSMWSDRVYQNGVVGLAWVGVICTNNRYNILRDFSTNPNFLRVMNSHELGHNFSALHDAAGSNFIMAPSVNSSNSWSSASISSIQNHYLSRTCLSSCLPPVPPPVANFTYNIIDACVVGQVQYTDQSSNATSWSWSFPGGTPATSTQQNPLVNYNNPGNFGASLTVTNVSGSNTKTLNNIIPINTTPNAQFTYSINGSSVVFGNQSTNANTYLWDFGDGNFSSLINPTHTYSDDGIYTVILTAYNDCGPDEYVAIITIATPPTANFTASPTEGCSGIQVQFNDGSSSNTTQWLWTFEGGTPGTSSLENPLIVYNTPGLYSVTLTATNPQGSNTLVRNQYIEIYPNPVASFTYVVNGTTVTFTNTSTNGTAFEWNFGDGIVSYATNPVHTYTSGGNYTVTLTVSNDCNTSTTSQVIVIITSPTAGISTANGTTGCAPATIEFISTSGNNPSSYEWIFEGGNPATSTEMNPVVTYNAAGNYDVELRVTNSFGSDTLVLEDYIEIITDPVFSFSFEQDSLTYAFDGSYQYQEDIYWQFGDNGTSTLEDPVHTYAAEGNYLVVLSVTNDCGTTSDSVLLSVVLPPSAGFTVNTNEGCAPFTVQYQDQSSANVTAWNWTFPGGIPQSSTERNPLVTYSQAGIFGATLQVSNSAGQSTLVQDNLITALTLPETGFLANVDENIVTLTNTAPDILSTEWQINDNGIQSLTGQEISYTFSANGTYQVTQINTNECGSSSYIWEVIIDAFPEASFNYTLQNSCAPVNIQYESTSVNGDSISWIFEGGSPAISEENSPLVNYNAPGMYSVTLVIFNELGTDTLVRSIEIIGAPEPGFTDTSNGSTVQFSNNTPGSGNSYSWNFGDGSPANTSENPQHTYAGPGTYTVVLTVTNACGTATSSREITIDNRFPVVSFNSSTQSGCVPFTVQYTDQTSNEPTAWLWTFEGGNPSTSTERNPVVTYANEGVFSVELTVSNAFGSSNTTLNNYITAYGPPLANFNYQLLDGQLNCTFTGNRVARYFWNFGDGATSEEKSPVHQYQRGGNYEVILIVQNDCGADTIIKNVTVSISATTNPVLDGKTSIQPNPNNGQYELVMSGFSPGTYQFLILDINGKICDQQKLTLQESNHKFILNHEHLQPGTYILRIMDKSNASQHHKLMILK